MDDSRAGTRCPLARTGKTVGPGRRHRQGDEQARLPRQPVAVAARSPSGSTGASAADAMPVEDAAASPACGQSKRKQRSMARSAENHRRRRVRDRMRHLLRLFVKRWRHERLWRVHNEWYPRWVAARSASAAAAGPPALGTERMDEESGSAASPAEQGTVQPSRSSGDGGSLNPSASEFVPGLPMAEVERAARAAAGEMAARQEAERRQTRKEARRLSEAAKAAVARSKAATVKALSKERVKRGAAMLIAEADPAPRPASRPRAYGALGIGRPSG